MAGDSTISPRTKRYLHASAACIAPVEAYVVGARNIQSSGLWLRGDVWAIWQLLAGVKGSCLQVRLNSRRQYADFVRRQSLICRHVIVPSLRCMRTKSAEFRIDATTRLGGSQHRL
jgi:hypothetical protein